MNEHSIYVGPYLECQDESKEQESGYDLFDDAIVEVGHDIPGTVKGNRRFFIPNLGLHSCSEREFSFDRFTGDIAPIALTYDNLMNETLAFMDEYREQIQKARSAFQVAEVRWGIVSDYS